MAHTAALKAVKPPMNAHPWIVRATVRRVLRMTQTGKLTSRPHSTTNAAMLTTSNSTAASRERSNPIAELAPAEASAILSSVTGGEQAPEDAERHNDGGSRHPLDQRDLAVDAVQS